MQKYALAVHDISCVGRCSLTVALPVLSAAGINTSIIPTALLSTHTGEFTGYTCLDLSDQLLPITEHLASLELAFDAFYSGYLTSGKQVHQVLDMLDQLSGAQTHIFVDPAFADHGRLYSGMEAAMAMEMRRLCAHAHTIVPNLTEACFLLGEPFPQELCYSRDFICELTRRLAALGPSNVVITGISFDKSTTGIAVYRRDMEKPMFLFTKRYDGVFHGTGDVFASFLLAALLSGKSLFSAAEMALTLTHDSIVFTLASGRPLRYGVQFERVIPKLCRMLGLSAMMGEDGSVEAGESLVSPAEHGGMQGTMT